MKKLTLGLMATALLSLGLQACGGDSNSDNANTPEAASEAPAQAVTIELNGGDDMKFDKAEITVSAGQEVTLVLRHTGKQPKATMGHNFVLLQNGVDPMDFGNKAAGAKDSDYIPKGSENEVIAHTRLLGGGESDSITFTPPASGVYDYLCSFPGHVALMKGKFLVID